jgi:hypothetical protein
MDFSRKQMNLRILQAYLSNLGKRALKVLSEIKTLGVLVSLSISVRRDKLYRAPDVSEPRQSIHQASPWPRPLAEFCLRRPHIISHHVNLSNRVCTRQRRLRASWLQKAHEGFMPSLVIRYQRRKSWSS